MTNPPTILISGATDGLGRALAEHLAADGARLILHGRDPAKLNQTAADLLATHRLPEPPGTVRADLADLAQVRDLSLQVAELTDHLDVLVNNAGIGAGSHEDATRSLSADGHELRFAVNYLAGFDLTLRLLGLLRAAGSARIVNVASLGQAAIDFDDVMLEHNYSGTRAYGQSKLAQITAGFTSPNGSPPTRSPSTACTPRRTCRPRSCSTRSDTASTASKTAKPPSTAWPPIPRWLV